MGETRDYHKAGSTRGRQTGSEAGVVLVHYGHPDTTWECVRSLQRHEGRQVSIYISDHGPGEALGASIPADVSGERLFVTTGENRGFGAGCNAAARRAFEAGSEWIWFLNNDAFIQSPILSNLLRLADRFPDVGMWGTLQRDGERVLGANRLPSWFPTPTPPTTAPAVECLPDRCRQLGPRETISGASILVSRKVWDEVGPWPEWCFLYWEDTAWGLHAHELGIPMVMTDLEVVHSGHMAAARHSRTTTYYGVRNSLLLHRDCWPSRGSQRLYQACHMLQKRFFQGNWHMLGPTLTGILDAHRGCRSRQR